MALLWACNKTPTPTPEKESPNSPPSASAASLDKSVQEAKSEAPPKETPTLVLEAFRPENKILQGIFPIEGALMVSADNRRVGRIVGEGVEWIGSIPEKNEPFGTAVVHTIHGRWPDAIDVVYRSVSGRAPQPTYFPLTGKGQSVMIAPGGGGGSINAFADLGESTIISTWTPFDGHRFYTVRGPKVVRKLHTIPQAGCKAGEVTVNPSWPIPPAIEPRAIAATKAGTLISLGMLCEKRGPAAEIWDKEGKARIVELKPWVKEGGYSPTMIPTKAGDEMYMLTSSNEAVLHYKDGNFDTLPLIEGNAQAKESGQKEEASKEFGIKELMLSPKDEVYVYTKQGFYRFRDKKWQAVGKPAWPLDYWQLAVDENDQLWLSVSGEPGDDETKYWPSSNGEVFRLKQGPSIAFRDDCKTPFVYIYDVSSVNAKNFTFPSTRKALATFPGVAEISLVEFFESKRRLGIIVPNKEQGEAVVAHIRANMKDEHPELLCYEPKDPRKIDIKKAK